MWQTDTIYLQTATDVNTKGSIKRTWADSATVLCDVQDIDKQYVYEEYGFTENTVYKQIFDHTNASWVKGSQVKYNDKQWIVRKIDSNYKIGLSNNTYIIISAVVE